MVLAVIWPTVTNLTRGPITALLPLLPPAFFFWRWQQAPALVALVARSCLVSSSWSSTCIGISGSLLSAVLCVLMRLPILPPLRGLYKVGTCKVNLTDSRRQMWPQAPWLSPGTRVLPTMIWYPAEPGPGYTKCPRSPFVRHKRKRVRMATEFKMPSFLLTHFERWQSRSRVGPPPAKPTLGSAGFPVVVFSCGWLAMRESCTLLAEELAAQGYIVMACDHVGDTPLTTFEEDVDAGSAAPISAMADSAKEPTVGLLVYMGHSNLREWRAARGWPATLPPGSKAGKGMNAVGIADVAAVAALLHGEKVDADGQPLPPNGRLWDAEAPTKGGVGWNAAVRKHGAVPMAEAMLRLQAFRRSQLKLRAGDCMFLVDAIEQLNASGTLPGPDGVARTPPCAALAALAGRIDVTRTLACGQSFGGATAVMAAACDKRFTAVVGFDPWMWTLPGHGTSLRSIFPNDRAHATVAAAALSCEPPAEELLGRRCAGVGGSDDQAPISLRCPAVFIGCERMWRPEISGEDVFGVDNRKEVAGLAARSSPAAALLYLDRANHFDLTDLTTYSPRVSAALGFTSPIHIVAGEYAAQELMLEAVLAGANAASKGSAGRASGRGQAPTPGVALAPLKEELSGHSPRFPGFVLLNYDELRAREGLPPSLSDGGDTISNDGSEGRASVTAPGGDAPQRRSRSPAPRQPKRPEEGDESTGPTRRKATQQVEASPVSWAVSLAEVLFTFLLPIALVLLVISAAGKRGLPGKPGDDLKLHRLAK